VPNEDVGYLNDGHAVTLAHLSRLEGVRLVMFDSILALASSRPISRSTNEARQKVWSDVANRLATEACDKVQIELALAHSSCMIANPDLVIDAGPRPRLSVR
jgi:RecB family exonuclease